MKNYLCQILHKGDKMKIRPLLDKVVLEPLEAEEKTASGILLPNSAQEKPSMAKVMEILYFVSISNFEL